MVFGKHSVMLIALLLGSAGGKTEIFSGILPCIVRTEKTQSFPWRREISYWRMPPDSWGKLFSNGEWWLKAKGWAEA